jgi:Nucleotidyl transferase AbiEii toxin, Type IV TA system
MQAFHRHHHQLIGKILASLDADFLRRTRCFFGGGTQIVLAHGEYRESRDIDFLCADQVGYRLLRETITDKSLGRIASKQLTLAREVRADRDGIRTFFLIDGARIKFEIIREARIALTGRMDSKVCVPVLSRECAIAEKLLANTDGGFDRSTHCRDLIDLAFVASTSTKKIILAGHQRALMSYGTSVSRQLQSTLTELQNDKALFAKCVKALSISDVPTLSKGLQKLRSVTGGTLL